MIEIIIGILIAWMVAEIGSGFIHFLEDSYGNPEWEKSPYAIKRLLYNNVVEANILHHKQPAAMLKGSYWHRNNTSIIPSFLLAGISYLFWPIFWPLWVGFILMSQANELHGWAHQKCSKPIRILQAIGILQSPKLHKIHHTRPYSQSYCVMSGWLNPILEAIFFWDIIRFIIFCLTGASPLEIRKAD